MPGCSMFAARSIGETEYWMGRRTESRTKRKHIERSVLSCYLYPYRGLTCVVPVRVTHMQARIVSERISSLDYDLPCSLEVNGRIY